MKEGERKREDENHQMSPNPPQMTLANPALHCDIGNTLAHSLTHSAPPKLAEQSNAVAQIGRAHV